MSAHPRAVSSPEGGLATKDMVSTTATVISSDGRKAEMSEEHDEQLAAGSLRIVAMLIWIVGVIGLIVTAVVAAAVYYMIA